MTDDRTTPQTPLFLCFFICCVLVAATAAVAGTPGVVPSADGTPIAYEVHGSGETTLSLLTS